MKFLIITFIFICSYIDNYSSFQNIYFDHQALQSNVKKQKNNLKVLDSLYKKSEFKKVIQYCITFLNSNNTQNPLYYEYILLSAKSYNELGDYSSAITYYNKAIGFSKKKNQRNLIDNYISIARVHRKIGDTNDLNKAIQFLLNAELLEKQKNYARPLIMYSINNNLGRNYMGLYSTNKADYYLKKGLKIAIENKYKEKIHISLINLGALYLNGPNTPSEELIISSKHYKNALLYDNKFNHVIYRNLGIISYLQNNPKEALKYHNKALELIYNSKLAGLKDLPNFNLIKKGTNERALNILYEKTYAWIKYHEQEKDDDFLIHALETIKLADAILDLNLAQITDEKSQLYWREQASLFYILGVTVCYKLNNSSKALYFIEKNKALLLLDNTIEEQIKKDIPKHLLEREMELKKDFYSFEFKTKSTTNKSITEARFKSRLKLQSFTDSLKIAYPTYFNYNKSKAIQSLEEIQDFIVDNKTVYISYIWENTENQYDALYGIAITKNETQLFKITDLDRFNQLVNCFSTSISKPFSNKEDIKEFQNCAFNLYNMLFPNKNIKNFLESHQKLIIIPDYSLQTIPFEALITKSNTNNYLILQNEISYAYSISYLIANSHLKRGYTNDFVGFAPKSFDKQQLKPLIYSEAEVKAIKNLIGGKTYLEQKATKENFLNFSPSSKIVHLATHADASINSWVAFRNETFKLHELYTYKCEADLVFLSACETSLGEIKKGEGVFSLARGFFYSGANSVISSLWNVNDKSNQEITVNFYKYLKKGHAKSAALRLSKLDYINTHSLSEVSPYYWSPLILIGDNSSIKFSNNLLYYTFLGIILIIFIFFIIKKLKLMGNIF